MRWTFQLRALGKSQESMASIVGCSLPAYQKWELGSLVPSAEWLLKMLQLCPDEETRNAFRIRPERRSAGRPKHSLSQNHPSMHRSASDSATLRARP